MQLKNWTTFSASRYNGFCPRKFFPRSNHVSAAYNLFGGQSRVPSHRAHRLFKSRLTFSKFVTAFSRIAQVTPETFYAKLWDAFFRDTTANEDNWVVNGFVVDCEAFIRRARDNGSFRALLIWTSPRLTKPETAANNGAGRLCFFRGVSNLSSGGLSLSLCLSLCGCSGAGTATPRPNKLRVKWCKAIVWPLLQLPLPAQSITDGRG